MCFVNSLCFSFLSRSKQELGQLTPCCLPWSSQLRTWNVALSGMACVLCLEVGRACVSARSELCVTNRAGGSCHTSPVCC